MSRRFFIAMILCSIAFAGCGESKSTSDLVTDLKSKDEVDRIKAVRLLQHRKADASTVVPALIESLEDQQADIRWGAAIGLGYFGAEAKSALPNLEKTLNDRDGRVRNAARVAISRIRD
jgi:HEAT repeat protein